MARTALEKDVYYEQRGMISMQAKYSRVLLKLSGEALAGDKHFGLNNEVIHRICTSILFRSGA